MFETKEHGGNQYTVGSRDSKGRARAPQRVNGGSATRYSRNPASTTYGAPHLGSRSRLRSLFFRHNLETTRMQLRPSSPPCGTVTPILQTAPFCRHHCPSGRRSSIIWTGTPRVRRMTSSRTARPSMRTSIFPSMRSRPKGPSATEKRGAGSKGRRSSGIPIYHRSKKGSPANHQRPGPLAGAGLTPIFQPVSRRPQTYRIPPKRAHPWQHRRQSS